MKTRALLILACVLGYTCMAQKNPSVPIAEQWHFDGNHYANGHAGNDWVYSILPTDKKEYICVGYTRTFNHGGWPPDPVIFKLDNLGRLVWSRVISSAAGVSGSGLSAGDNGGSFRQVIKTPNGYAACGFFYDNTVGGKTYTLVVEVDESGNLLYTPLLVHPVISGTTTNRSEGHTLAMSPNNDYLFIGGIAEIQQSYTWEAASIIKLNYSTHAVSGTPYFGGGAYGSTSFGGNDITKILTTVTSGSYPSFTYNILACGHQSVSTDNVDVFGWSGYTYTTVHTRNKDIWFLNLNSSLSMNYDRTYNKSDLKSVHYNETGPVSARNVNVNSSSSGFSSPLVKDNLKESVNHDERGVDMVATADGKVALLALVNFISLTDLSEGGNGEYLINATYSATPDVTRGEGYDDYHDGDAYLLKIDPSTGSMDWNKNVSHFSGSDFKPKVVQTQLGNYVILGTTLDYYSSSSDVEQFEENAMLLVSTEDDSTTGHIWRRTATADQEDCVCTFALANTADGGVITGGNNDGLDGLDTTYADDWSITKFAPPCAALLNYNSGNPYDIVGTGNSGEYHITSSVLWNTNMKVAAKVIVDSGKSLTIQNCNIDFASSDHMYDYYDFPTVSTDGVAIGIVVKRGGHLTVDNATLRGVHECGNAYMWDGVVIQGDPTQYYSSHNHGTVYLTNAHIEDARVGIQVSDASRTYVQSTVNPSTANPGVTGCNFSSGYVNSINYGGGQVTATNSTFENCRFSVNHQLYMKGNAIGNYTNCTFTCTGAMKDPCFYAGFDGNGEPSDDFFAAWQVEGLQFHGNTFNGNPAFDYRYKRGGIILIDAYADISAPCTSPQANGPCLAYGTGNSFYNLGNSIEANYSAAINGHAVNVYGNTFDNNIKGVATNGSNYITILNNTFLIPDRSHAISTDLSAWANGVQLVACRNYEVANNTFDHCTACGGANSAIGNWGIQVFNNSVNDEQVRLNTFDNINYQCASIMVNGGPVSGLQWRCNDFNGSTPLTGTGTGYYDIYRSSRIYFTSQQTVPGTIRADQGMCQYDPSPAGNRFLNDCYAGRSHLSEDGYVTQNVNYHANAPISDYDPDNGSPCHLFYYTVTGNYCSGSIAHSAACPPFNGYSDPKSSASMMAHLGEVNAAIAGLESGDASLPDYITEQNLQVSELVRFYTQRGATDSTDTTGVNNDSAANLLTSYGRYADAVFLYITAGNWAKANTTWYSLPTSNLEEQRYAWLTRKSIDLGSIGQTWFDLDSTSRDTVRNMITGDTYTGYLAETIDALINGRHNRWPVALIDSADSTGLRPGTIKQAATVTNDIFSFYPNPTTGNFTLNSVEAGTLTISGIDGREIREYQISAGKTTLALPANLSAGIYMGKFKTSNKAQVVRIIYSPGQ